MHISLLQFEHRMYSLKILIPGQPSGSKLSLRALNLLPLKIISRQDVHLNVY
jgi:hypothetical protein